MHSRIKSPRYTAGPDSCDARAACSSSSKQQGGSEKNSSTRIDSQQQTGRSRSHQSCMLPAATARSKSNQSCMLLHTVCKERKQASMSEFATSNDPPGLHIAHRAHKRGANRPMTGTVLAAATLCSACLQLLWQYHHLSCWTRWPLMRLGCDLGPAPGPAAVARCPPPLSHHPAAAGVQPTPRPLDASEQVTNCAGMLFWIVIQLCPKKLVPTCSYDAPTYISLETNSAWMQFGNPNSLKLPANGLWSADKTTWFQAGPGSHNFSCSCAEPQPLNDNCFFCTCTADLAKGHLI